MTEMMLADAAAAHDFAYVALRYFNVAGADPRAGPASRRRGATHLIKVACETALGKRDQMTVYGTDYPTADGTCMRDYIHVSDLVAAHGDALRHLRDGGGSLVANCGYGRGFSVLEVIDTVKRVSGSDFRVMLGDKASRRPGGDRRLAGIDHGASRLASPLSPISTRSSMARSAGKSAHPPQPDDE